MYWFPPVDEDFFWPLDTPGARDAFSSKVGLRHYDWHPFSRGEVIWWGWQQECSQDKPALKHEEVMAFWNSYYPPLVVKKNDALDRWIDEHLRNLGLDPESFKEGEEKDK